MNADANVSSHKVAVELVLLGRELFEKVHNQSMGPRSRPPIS